MQEKYGYLPYSFSKQIKNSGVKQGMTPEFFVKSFYGATYISDKLSWYDIWSCHMCDAYKISDVQKIYNQPVTKTLREKILQSVGEFSVLARAYYESKRVARS